MNIIANFETMYYIINMKVNIIAVGSIKEKYYTDAISEYKKRLSRFCEIKIIEVQEDSKNTSIEKKNENEGHSLLSYAKGVIVALDKGGKLISSEGLASEIAKWQVTGSSEISFLIGGSNGLSAEVLKKSNLVISFGNITFPHQLFRVVLMEQIYRAFTINAKLPYHK